MITSALDESMIRLEGIKENNQKYNKSKIAEAEALAAEALRMANEAKKAAARLAEVKKMLSTCSKKVKKVEESVKKDAETQVTIREEIEEIKEVNSTDPVAEEEATEDQKSENLAEDVESEDVRIFSDVGLGDVEEESKPDPVENTPHIQKQPETSVVSQNLVGNNVVKVVETAKQTAVPKPIQKEELMDSQPTIPDQKMFVFEPVSEPKQATYYESQDWASVRAAPTPVRMPLYPYHEEYFYLAGAPPTHSLVLEEEKKDVIEDFFDSMGIDKMCGVDDSTLGFTDRPEPPPPQKKKDLSPVFENPTRVQVSDPVDPNQVIHSVSWKEKIATVQRMERNLPPKQYQQSNVNRNFADPFGVDHDDLVVCGRIADLCEPPDFEEEFEYQVPSEYSLRQ